MPSISVDIPNISLSDIKRQFHLDDLCVADTAQLENIATVIQSLYFYYPIIASGRYPRSLEAAQCRTFIILSYSVIEAIVICVGYKIQQCCIRCRRSCPYKSTSMFQESDAKKNEKKAFFNADKFLKQVGILNLTKNAKDFYEGFRDSRNNVHLARNTDPIANNRMYTPEACKMAFEYLCGLLELLRDNYLEFVSTHGCGR